MPPPATPNPQRRAAVWGTLLWLLVAGWLVWRGHAAWVPAWLAVALLANPLGLALCFALICWRCGVPGRVALKAWWREIRLVVQVFGWQQPWRADAHPDYVPSVARRGVVLVHGLLCNRGFWNHWLPALRARGTPCAAVTLTPVFGDIDGYVPTIAQSVARLEAATGQPPLLVGHSMGGLAIRAYLRSPGAAACGVVTLGTPHQGTWLAWLPLPGRNLHQMRAGSAWLTALAADEGRTGTPPAVCVDSEADQIVCPPGAAQWPGKRWLRLPGVPHLALAHEARVWALVLEEIEAKGRASPQSD